MLDHLDIVRGRRHLHLHVPLMGLHHTANVSKFVSSFLSLSPGSGVSFCHLSLVTYLSYYVIEEIFLLPPDISNNGGESSSLSC